MQKPPPKKNNALSLGQQKIKLVHVAPNLDINIFAGV